MAITPLVSTGNSLSGPYSPPIYIPALPIAGAIRRYMSRYLTGAVSSTVASLPDLGTDNAPLVQTDSTRRPTIILENGIKTISFNGTDDVLTNTITVQNPITTEAFTQYTVAYIPAFAGSTKIPWSIANKRPLLAGGSNSVSLSGPSLGGVSPLTYTPGYHFVAIQLYPNGNSKLTIDGSVGTAGATGTSAANPYNVGGFGATDTTYTTAIKLVEQGVFRTTSAPLSDSDVQVLRTFMKAQYPFLP